MTTITFDTHQFIKRLTAAGMPEPQAEILAQQQTELIEDRLATKDDLERLELKINSQIEIAKDKVPDSFILLSLSCQDDGRTRK